MTLKKYVKHYFFLHCVHMLSAKGLNPLTNFQKRGPDRISIFRGRLLEKKGDFFQEWGGVAVFT